MRLWLLPALILLFAFGPSEEPSPVGGKPLGGTYHEGKGIFDAEKGKTCRLDSAAGATLYLEADHDNPLFESKAPNKVHLMVWWKSAPQTGVRYQLPDPQIEICYWEQGDLLMFHTFTGQGWLEIEKLKEGKYISGRLDLKLVKPHHNFSNSDYHYLGGGFKAGIE